MIFIMNFCEKEAETAILYDFSYEKDKKLN